MALSGERWAPFIGPLAGANSSFQLLELTDRRTDGRRKWRPPEDAHPGRGGATSNGSIRWPPFIIWFDELLCWSLCLFVRPSGASLLMLSLPPPPPSSSVVVGEPQRRPAESSAEEVHLGGSKWPFSCEQQVRRVQICHPKASSSSSPSLPPPL